MKKIIGIILWIVLWTISQPLEIVVHYVKGLVGGIRTICGVESGEYETIIYTRPFNDEGDYWL